MRYGPESPSHSIPRGRQEAAAPSKANRVDGSSLLGRSTQLKSHPLFVSTLGILVLRSCGNRPDNLGGAAGQSQAQYVLQEAKGWIITGWWQEPSGGVKSRP